MEADVDSPPKPTMEADVYAFAMVALEVSHIPSVRGSSLGTPQAGRLRTRLLSVLASRYIVKQSLTLPISFRS